MEARATFTDFFRSLGRGYTYYPSLVKIAGSVNACIMLSLFLHWHGKGRSSGGWIYKTQIEIEEETGLKKDAQQAARKELKGRGYLREMYADNPRRLYYLLDVDAINAAWQAEFGQTDKKDEQNQHNAVSTAARSGNSLTQGGGKCRSSVYIENNNKETTTISEQSTAAPLSVVVTTEVLEEAESECNQCNQTEPDTFAAVRPFVTEYPELARQYGTDTLLRALVITQQDGHDLSPKNGTGRYIRGVCRNGAVIPVVTMPKPKTPTDPARANILGKLREGMRIQIDGQRYNYADPGIMIDGRMIPRTMMVDLILTGKAILEDGCDQQNQLRE